MNAHAEDIELARELPHVAPGAKPKRSALEFIQTHGDLLLKRVIDTYPPVYDGVVPDRVLGHLAAIKRSPFPAQKHAVAALLTRFAQPGANDAPFVGEMGVGKTLCALAQAHVLIQEQYGGAGRVLVLCPTHLLKKWRAETHATLPGCDVRILRTVSDVDAAFAKRPVGAQVLLLSKETAKLGMPREPAFWKSASKKDGVFFCPHCGAGDITYQDPNHTRNEDLETHPPNPESGKLPFCAGCRAPLWTWRRLPGGRARFPLAEYIARRRFVVEIFIPDEAHQFKGGNTAQGAAFYRLARQAKKILLLTGTIVNGYSSSLFYLLYRICPEVRRDFRFGEVDRWVQLYGFTEKIIKHEEDDDGVVTRKYASRESIRERPGISPVVFKYLLGRTVFLSLRDIHEALPSFEEVPIAIDMQKDQKGLYQTIESGFRHLSGRERDPKSMGTFLQVLLAWPDNPWKGETIVNRAGRPVFEVPALDDTAETEKLLPKEEKLLEIIGQEARERRKVFVFATFTGRRDVEPRIERVLRRAGLSVAVLRSDTIKAEDRMEWIEHASRSADVLIANPRLVEVGLDLIDFPTLIYYQTEYSLYTLRQSSRRSWRIGQTRPVKVYYLYYGDGAQEKATALIGKKLAAALMIDGESIPEQGLAAGEGSSVLSELSEALMRDTRLPDIRELFAKSRIQGGIHPPTTETLIPPPLTAGRPVFDLVTGGGMESSAPTMPRAPAGTGETPNATQVEPTLPKIGRKGQYLLF